MKKEKYRINFSIINYVRRNTSPTANSVFDEIYFEFGRKKESVEWSNGKLAERLPIGVATVKRAVEELEELGYITNLNKNKRNSSGKFKCSNWMVNVEYIISIIPTEYQNDTRTEYQNDTRTEYQNDTDNNNYNKKSNYQYQNDTGINEPLTGLASTFVEEEKNFVTSNTLEVSSPSSSLCEDSGMGFKRINYENSNGLPF